MEDAAEQKVDAGTPVTPPALSFPERLLGVFMSPAETLADVARHPGFWAPLITLIVASIAVVETMLGKIGVERILRSQIAQSSQAARMPPSQIEEGVRQGGRIVAIFMRLAAVLGPPFILLLLAVLGLLIVNLILGGHLGFKAVFSLVCYANLITLLSSLMAVLVILFGDPDHLNPQNPVPTNLAFFLNQGQVSKRLYALASSADIFTVWVLILISVGLSEGTERKVKPQHIFFVYAGFWAVWILIKLGLASL
jgi:hypothetical protein